MVLWTLNRIVLYLNFHFKLLRQIYIIFWIELFYILWPIDLYIWSSITIFIFLGLLIRSISGLSNCSDFALRKIFIFGAKKDLSNLLYYFISLGFVIGPIIPYLKYLHIKKLSYFLCRKIIKNCSDFELKNCNITL